MRLPLDVILRASLVLLRKTREVIRAYRAILRDMPEQQRAQLEKRQWHSWRDCAPTSLMSAALLDAEEYLLLDYRSIVE